VKVKLTIEELVLRGLAQGEETAVLAALEVELARLFGEANPHWSQVDGQQPISLTVAPDAEPAAIGQQIGQAIFGATTHE